MLSSTIARSSLATFDLWAQSLAPLGRASRPVLTLRRKQAWTPVLPRNEFLRAGVPHVE